MPQGRETGSSEFLQGQIGNHRFAVPVRKCLDSHDCFVLFFQIGGGGGGLTCYNKIFKFASYLEKFHFVGIKVFFNQNIELNVTENH